RTQLLEELREERDMECVDLSDLRDLLLVALVVRDRVVRIRYADLGIRPARDLTPDHERDDAREIGFVRQRLQVEHELGVLADRVRNPRWLIDNRKSPRALRLGLLNSPFDIPDGLQILCELRPITWSQSSLQIAHAFDNRVEEAAVLLKARATGG